MRPQFTLAALLAAVLAPVLVIALAGPMSPARADIFPPAGLPAAAVPAKAILHLPLNVDDYGAIGDGNSHPLSGFYATAALAAVQCPSLNFFIGTQHTGNTNTSTTLTSVGTVSPYVISGMTITDSLGDIPGSTTVTAVNYSTGAVTISQAATGTHTGDVFTIRVPNVNWANVEMDWCAIDAALWASRASATAVLYSLPIALNPKNYVVNVPLNLSCFSSPSATGNSCAITGDFGSTVIYGNGANILGGYTFADPGSNAADLLGSSQIIIHDLTIFAGASGNNCTGSELKRGIQLGPSNPGMSADRMHFDNVFVQGCFLQAPLYNEASESFYNERSQYENGDGGGSAYLGIWDGGNHFGVTSDYVNVAFTANSPQTFNGATEVHTVYLPWSSGPTPSGNGLFIYGTIGQNLGSAYVDVPATAPGPCITLYNDNGGTYGSFAQNLHAKGFSCENGGGTGATATFAIVSKTAGATPTLKGFEYNTWDDPAASAGSIFALVTNTNALTLQDPTVKIANFFHAPNFFDTPANYTVTGATIELPTGFAGDNIAAGWTGSKCVGAVCKINTGTILATGGALSGLTGLAIRDTSAAFDVTLAGTSSTTLTAGRALTFDVVNAARTVKLGANLTIATDPGGVTGAVKSNGTGTFAQAAFSDLAASTISATQAGSLTGTANALMTGGGANAYPNFVALTGLVKGNGASAPTAVTAPAGAVVGTSDTQTLTGKTLTDPINQEAHVLTTGWTNSGTTPSTLVGLDQAFTAAGLYSCSGMIHFTTAPTSSNGLKIALVSDGTVTVNTLMFNALATAVSAIVGTGTTSALGSNVFGVTAAITDVYLNAVININVAGTIHVQMAENAASGTIAATAGNARWNCHRAA